MEEFVMKRPVFDEAKSDLTKYGVTMRPMVVVRGSGDQSSVASQQSGWMQYNHQATDSLNINEMTSLRALIAYVATITGRTEFGVERQFSDHFKIPNVKCLPSCDYDLAIRFLVDLVPSELSASA